MPGTWLAGAVSMGLPEGVSLWARQVATLSPAGYSSQALDLWPCGCRNGDAGSWWESSVATYQLTAAGQARPLLYCVLPIK